MKKYMIIPVAYRQFINEDVGYLVKEIFTFSDSGRKNELLKQYRGTEALEFLLNCGWKIQSVQSVAIAEDKEHGFGCSAFFQYILESPEMADDDAQ